MQLFSKVGLCLLSLASSAYTAAIWAPQASGISQSDFDTIFLYEQYAAAAYCERQWSDDSSYGGPTSPINCSGASVDNCPAVEQGTTATLKIDNSGTDQGGTYYIGVDTTNSHIVVAFRGVDERASKDITRAEDAGSDESVPFTQLCDGCNGNPVLLTDYMYNNATIINEVNRLVNIPTYNDYTIVTVGHSWGGALANLAVIALRGAFPNKIVDVATYGANEAGDEAFANFISGQQPARGRNFRVWHVGDPTPNALRNAGHNEYRVFYPGYSITTGNAPTSGPLPNVTKADINRLPDDITAQNSASSSNGLAAHRTYLNRVSACW